MARTRRAERIGTQDLVAAIPGATAVTAAVLVLTQPFALRTMPSAWSAMVVVGVVALVVPAMAVGTHAGHDHAELALEHVHAGGAVREHGGAAHDHSAVAAGHDHASGSVRTA